MCGRYASTKGLAELAADFDAVDDTGGDAPTPDHNVAPTKRVFAIVQRPVQQPAHDDGVDLDAVTDVPGDTADDGANDTVRAIRVMRWGLVPHWAKDAKVGYKMINARAETVASKPAFRRALAHKRCLLPLDGWYEWRRDAVPADESPADESAGDTKKAKKPKVIKTPFFMHRVDGEQLVMAGLWSAWRDPKADDDAPPLITCSVITTASRSQLTEVHDRMPLLLAPQAFDRWLDPETSDVSDLLTPAGDDILDAIELRPVRDLVNSVRNNGPELIEPFDSTVNVDQPALLRP